MNWQNVTVKLSDLQPWEHNPRTMTKRQAQRLLKSWQDLGQFQTIAIGPQGQVYDGHQRLSALLAAHGAAFTVDARQSERELSEDERRYLTTQANLPVGAWNWDALAGWDAAQLQAWGFDDEALRAWNSDAANLATMIGVENYQSETSNIFDTADLPDLEQGDSLRSYILYLTFRTFEELNEVVQAYSGNHLKPSDRFSSADGEKLKKLLNGNTDGT